MTTVNLHEFKAHLSAYAREVKEGGTVVICERNVPFAELRPLAKTVSGKRPAPGLFKGQIQVTEAFFDADADLERDFNS